MNWQSQTIDYCSVKWNIGEVDVTAEFLEYRADVVLAAKRYSTLSVADKL